MSPARIGTLACALALVAGTPASAEPVRDTKHRFQLSLAQGAWTVLPTDASHTEPLLAMRSKRGSRYLAISRFDVKNPRAWRSDKHFFQTVERGVRDKVVGYKRIHRKRRRLTRRVPAFDLVFSRDRGGKREVVTMRFLFFRRYTLSLAVSEPIRVYKRNRRTTRKLMESFKPFLTRR